MREVTEKSMKLNRDLEKMLVEALERDLLVRIGWGRNGDEKPKEGEIGVITHLPEKSRVLLLGNLGECCGAMNRGGTLTIQGGCSSMAGAFQEGGRLIIEKDVGDRVGSNMTGGFINIQGSAANFAGESMKEGTILIRGHAGEKIGAGMSGGNIVVLGSVGKDPGLGMIGGKVFVAGNCPPAGEGAEIREISPKEIIEISEHLEPLGLSINKDALVIVPSEKDPVVLERPEISIMEGLEKILLVPSGKNRQTLYEKLDTSTMLKSVNEDGGLIFPIPWLVEKDEKMIIEHEDEIQQPFLVRKSPRDIDFLIVDQENIVDASEHLKKCSGIVVNLESLPKMNDAELEGLIISLRSKMMKKSIVMLRDRVDRVENLLRMIIDLNLDGAIINASTPGGSRASAALPRIGLASRAMNIKEQGKHLLLKLDETPTAEDFIVAKGAGCSLIVAPNKDEKIEETLLWLKSTLNGWMSDLGVQNLNEITRRNLRAVDYDTAAISGLRLIGYDRPLPMWLGN